MKKIVLTILVAATTATAVFAGSAFENAAIRKMRTGRGGRGSDAQNVIKLKPVGLALGMFTAQYERALNEDMSVALDITFMSRSVSLDFSGVSAATTSVSGFGFSPEFRYYFAGEAPHRSYVAPFFEYLSIGMKVEGTDVQTGSKTSASINGFSAIGGGVLFGYQFLIGGVFSIDTNLGFRYISLGTPTSIDFDVNGTKTSKAFPSYSVSGFLPAGNLSLGFAF